MVHMLSPDIFPQCAGLVVKRGYARVELLYLTITTYEGDQHAVRPRMGLLRMQEQVGCCWALAVGVYIEY